MQLSHYSHAAGINFILYEGNDGTGLALDAVHGTQHFITAFRNRFTGWETGKTTQTYAAANAAFSRYTNILGNILGTTGYHTDYLAGSNAAIYHLDYSGGGGAPSDSFVTTSMYRWGNWDTVTNAVRWCTDATAPCTASEVPTGISPYAQSVPANHTLPNSFIHASKPSWFGNVTWPPIGPDVTGGNVANTGGYVYKIPARVCYEAGAKDGSGKLTAFNGTTCYASSSLPSAPTNVRIR